MRYIHVLLFLLVGSMEAEEASLSVRSHTLSVAPLPITKLMVMGKHCFEG